MTKHLIGADIVHHRLVGMPHLIQIDTHEANPRPAAPALDPVRGIGIAVVVSLALWAALFVGIA